MRCNETTPIGMSAWNTDAAGSRLARWQNMLPQSGLYTVWLKRPSDRQPGEKPQAAGDLEAAIGAGVATLALLFPPRRALRIAFARNNGHKPRHVEAGTAGDTEQRSPEATLALCELRLRDSRSDPAVPVQWWINGRARMEGNAPLYTSLGRRLMARLSPLFLDAVRQRRTDRLNGKLQSSLVAFGQQNRRRNDAAQRPRSGRMEPLRKPTLLISLRWLEIGGAEAFAIATMEAAVQAGFCVVVTCDTIGRHDLLGRASCFATAIYLLDEAASMAPAAELFRRVIDHHRPDILHIQHSALAYAALPSIREVLPDCRIIDTNHIVEHRSGGYVAEAIRYSRYIDRHHVISDRLRRKLIDQGGIPSGRVRLGRLCDLSRDLAPRGGKWDRARPLQLAFVGRFTQQKRPFLFIEAAARLVRLHGSTAFSFTAVGSGEMRPMCEDMARRRGLQADLFRFVDGADGASTVLADAHLLLIPSDNEGLTLVAFEAIRADCLVCSCDVGAQSEIVLPNLLVSREPFACVREMVAVATAIHGATVPIIELLEAQHERLRENERAPTGLQACDYAGLLGRT